MTINLRGLLFALSLWLSGFFFGRIITFYARISSNLISLASMAGESKKLEGLVVWKSITEVGLFLNSTRYFFLSLWTLAVVILVWRLGKSSKFEAFLRSASFWLFLINLLGLGIFLALVISYLTYPYSYLLKVSN